MKNLGDYAVTESLGTGALGEVVLAQHRFLKRPYALKILARELTERPGFVDRFEREILALSQLDHPHIVKMHNVSEDQGYYFLVADCIMAESGKPLTLWKYFQQKGGRFAEEEILDILKQVASALDFAHGKNQTHLGLKPSNILVKDKKVYLSDFGLTRVVGSAEFLERTYQALPQTVGNDPHKMGGTHLSFLQSYLFLAPEQKTSPEKVGPKSDSYAFGVLAYFLLTGKFPEGFFEMPSQPYKFAWEKLVRACLQSEPSKRPSSLVEALGAITAETPTSSAEELKPVFKPQELKRPEFDADPGAIFQTETVVVKYQPKEEEVQVAEPLNGEMVVIRGGSFQRGSNYGGRDEVPRHTVTLSSFAIDIHPVTNEQFVRFLEAMGGEKDHNNNDIIRLRESRIKRFGGKLQIESGYSKHPVVGVTWYGAEAYAKWVGKRLPTEAEWEVAASCNLDDNIYPTGKNIERSQANFFSSDTTPVMSYPPNYFGLYDMAGNVYEWCSDWYDYHYYNVSVQEPQSPKGPHQGVYRVLRGGCWKSLKEDLRCAHRHRNNPGTVNGTYGFRCVADVKGGDG